MNNLWYFIYKRWFKSNCGRFRKTC